jgi:polyisoprenoid-binding protein YceI
VPLAVTGHWFVVEGRPLLAAAALVFLGSVAPAAAGAPFRVDRGDVRVTVPLRPGGAFEAKTTSVSGAVTPGAGRPLALDGEISVDLGTIDTGIALRNQHLREKYLEVARGAGFDKAVLSEIRLGDADGEAFQGRTAFTGALLLHGAKRSVSGTAEIRREGAAVRVEASFPLTLTDFGIEPPEYLGVGVANRIIVKVLFTATPAESRR